MERGIVHEVGFKRPIENVYDYITTIKHWPEWYPATLAVEGDTDHPAQVGDTVVEQVRKLGLSGTLRWVVVESKRPTRFVIETRSIDLFLFKAASFRIAYELAAEPGGTRLLRTWHCDLPSAWLRMLYRVHLHRDLSAESAGALRTLERLVEGAYPRDAQPRPRGVHDAHGDGA